MEGRIIHQDQCLEIFTEEHCFITELVNTSNLEHLSLARARVAPGVTTALHALDETHEIYYILQGEGVVEISDVELGRVASGDSVMIPAGSAQRIRNTGEVDLIFLCICTPRFREDCYRAL